jgi:ABC-type molybdate transport system substrate-binding protein
MTRTIRVSLALLTLLLVLGSGTANAFPRNGVRAKAGTVQVAGSLAGAWNWLASLFTKVVSSVVSSDPVPTSPTGPPIGPQNNGGSFYDPLGGD